MKSSVKLLRVVQDVVSSWRRGELSAESGIFALSLFINSDSPTKKDVALARKMFKIYKDGQKTAKKVKI